MGISKTKSKSAGEKIFLVSDQAIIKQENRTIKLADLGVGDTIVVVGSNQKNGRLEAKIARIQPL